MKKRYFVSGYEEMPFKDLLVLDDSNMKKEDLPSDYWIDCTEILEGMREIAKKRYKTGHDTLYETKNGSKVLIYTSYRQGKGEVIAFLPEEIKTIYEAREYIQQELEEFFGYM